MILKRLLDLEKHPGARAYTGEEYDLERYAAWLEALGSPHRSLHALHIAGTKGKGSTAAICEALLRGIGFPTCLYTSPHLAHFGERFRFDGMAWTADQFETALEAFLSGLLPHQRGGFDGPRPFRTVFETLTALAFVEFARAEPAAQGDLPRISVLETGLGGRLDCTNVIDPLVSVITALGLDHTGLLGNRIEQIAAEKAGIIKPGRPVIVARQEPAQFDKVWPVIRDRAAEVGAPLIRAWEQNPVTVRAHTPTGLQCHVRLPDGREMEVHLPLRGAFQAANLEAALAAVWYIARDYMVPPDGETIVAGLQLVNWSGRIEVHESPAGGMLILDGAHCPLSARALGAELARLLEQHKHGRRFQLLFCMQLDKDHMAFLRALREGMSERCELTRVVACPVPGPRGAAPQALAEMARTLEFDAVACNTADEAFNAALDSGQHIVASGSLYLLAHFRTLWHARHAENSRAAS